MIAFDKLDGSNLRFGWQRKKGWHIFGTRTRLFDASNPEYGCAIELFKQTYAEGIEKVIRDNKDYRGVTECIAFCEFFGPSSFAGWHDFFDPNCVTPEPKELVLFDVNIHKRGFVLPREFLNNFRHLKIPKVIYEGRFGPQFVDDIKESRYPVTLEGVVCKGIIEGKKKNPQHGLLSTFTKRKP